MALDINKATYGRNTTGIKKLRTDLLNDIKRAQNSLSPKEDAYRKVLAKVNQYWAGEDAQRFKDVFATKVEEIQHQMGVYTAQIEQAFAEDQQQFAKLQMNNASSLKK